jgi:hypothetical protein
MRKAELSWSTEELSCEKYTFIVSVQVSAFVAELGQL